MDRSKLGKILLLTLALPFAAYLLINCIAGYIPPTESYKKRRISSKKRLMSRWRNMG